MERHPKQDSYDEQLELDMEREKEIETEKDAIFAYISDKVLEAHYQVEDILEKYYDPIKDEKDNRDNILQKVVEVIYGY